MDEQKPPTFQQQVDALTATITRAVAGLNGAIEMIYVQAAQLQQQLTSVTKERDDLKRQLESELTKTKKEPK